VGKLSDLKIPVFWAEGRPEIPSTGYVFRIGGLVERPMEIDIEEFGRLATDAVSCRLTSVTRWSVRLEWKGVLTSRICEMVGPKPGARFITLTSFRGLYTTAVRLEDLKHPRAIFAIQADDEPLPVEYGGPVRAVFPHLWGYKSAKSIVAIEFRDSYERGYWETRGYEGDASILATKLFDVNTRQTRAHTGGEVPW
jgi:DMSO/TMAO reductase YedYZ molybdopterin-dependent catalytic subunit